MTDEAKHTPLALRTKLLDYDARKLGMEWTHEGNLPQRAAALAKAAP